MTPRTFWDRNGNLWELTDTGLSCYLLWHNEFGEDWVRLVPYSDMSRMVGCSLLEVALVYRPLVASC